MYIYIHTHTHIRSLSRSCRLIYICALITVTHTCVSCRQVDVIITFLLSEGVPGIEARVKMLLHQNDADFTQVQMHVHLPIYMPFLSKLPCNRMFLLSAPLRLQRACTQTHAFSSDTFTCVQNSQKCGNTCTFAKTSLLSQLLFVNFLSLTSK